MVQEFVVNRNLRRILKSEDKKSTAVAERAGMRKDTFSRIINCRRPVYADEVIPLARALNVSVEELFREPVEEADCG